MDNIRYSNGKIYRLVNDVDDEFYVGSTCMTLSKRFYGHKRKAKIVPNRKVYQHFNTIGWDKVKIILIEQYPCNDKLQLTRREREIIEQLKPSLNVCIPTRTNQEYRVDNREHIRKINQDYHQANKEVRNERAKKWREQNKEQCAHNIKSWRENNKDKHSSNQKEYYENNKERLAAYRKAYYEKNKEMLSQKNKEQYKLKKASMT
jgi:hypothetical protein